MKWFIVKKLLGCDWIGISKCLKDININFENNQIIFQIWLPGVPTKGFKNQIRT